MASEDEVIENAVDLYIRKIKWLADNRRPSVILCVVPESFVQHFNPNTKPVADEQQSENNSQTDELEQEENGTTQEHNFRRMLKARAMKHHIPIQIVRDRIRNPSGEMQGSSQYRLENLGIQ